MFVKKRIVFFLFSIISCAIYSQKKPFIKKPEFKTTSGKTWDNICVRDDRKFGVIFGFGGGKFNPGNVFNVELSDANGDFSKPVIIGSLNKDYNKFRNIKIMGLKFPKSSYGSGYKIRVVGTSPKREGQPSKAFSIYYRDIKVDGLNLNKGKNLVLCDDKPVSISLSLRSGQPFKPKHKFRWYKNGGEQIPGETGTTLKISKEGEYYARLELGPCTSSPAQKVESYHVVVTRLGNDSPLTIKGESTIELCPNDHYVLEASKDDSKLSYTWYKDGVEIKGVQNNRSKYGLPKGPDRYGKYYVQVGSSASGCTQRSQEVVVKSKAGGSFKVSIDGDKSRAIIAGQKVQLKVVTDAKSPKYQWYKDGKKVDGAAGEIFEINAAGDYKVEVSSNEVGGCSDPVFSEVVKIVSVSKLAVELVYDQEYKPCSSTSVTLQAKAMGITNKGDKVPLDDSVSKNLTYKWFKEGKELSFNTSSIELKTLDDNGSYHVVASSSSIGAGGKKSNVLEVSLAKEGFTLTSSVKYLCEGVKSKLTFAFEDKEVTDYDFKWFKDATELSQKTPSIEVDKTGVYKVKFKAFGCDRELTFELLYFDQSVIKIAPEGALMFKEGESLELTASGADSYQWLDPNDQVLSSDAKVTITQSGTYTLNAVSGSCTLVKIVEIQEGNGIVVVSNLISPYNNDGICDKWLLPAQFVNTPDVKVEIYDTSGAVLFSRTNYQNDWPISLSELKNNKLVYYRIIKKDKVVKAGTISVIE